MAKKGRTVAYLRVSTAEQSNDKFQAAILKFANEKKFGHVDFVLEVVSGKVNWRKRKIGVRIPPHSDHSFRYKLTTDSAA